MLPFLQPKKLAATILARRKDNKPADEYSEGEHSDKLMQCAEKLIKGIHDKNATEVADAIKTAFKHLEEAEGESDASDEKQE